MNCSELVRLKLTLFHSIIKWGPTWAICIVSCKHNFMVNVLDCVTFKIISDIGFGNPWCGNMGQSVTGILHEAVI